jgi:hypothetical protein
MFRALLYFFLVYLAYRFVFNFLVPVYKATQQVKKGFRDMHDRMNSQQDANSSSYQQSQSPNNSEKPAGDYIDFEEIK